MKNIYLLIFLLLVFFEANSQQKFVKYQTFDEYKMQGIKEKRIKYPCVYIKENGDTIFVRKSYDKNIITYIKKPDFWYTKLKIEEKSTFTDRYRVCEKFIYNDTIIEYEYIKKNDGKIFGITIFVHTKTDYLQLNLSDTDINNSSNVYKQIKKLVNNYKDFFPLYVSGKYQPRDYIFYSKHIDKNILTIYEVNEQGRTHVASKKMNTLGEFDNKGLIAWWY